MTTGILVMTYGSAKSAEDVLAYMTRVRGGRTPSEDLVAEFQRRYALIGGSPLAGSGHSHCQEEILTEASSA